jgi:hypothetical protein
MIVVCKRQLKLIEVATDGQSASVYLGVGLPSGTYDQIVLFCLTIVGFLMLSTLSDERIGIYNCSGVERAVTFGSKSHRTQTIFSCLIWDSPKLGRGPGPHIYISQERGGSVIPKGNGFPFRRLLWLTGLRRRRIPYGRNCGFLAAIIEHEPNQQYARSHSRHLKKNVYILLFCDAYCSCSVKTKLRIVQNVCANIRSN